MKRLSRTEYWLFLVPFLIVPAYWLVHKIHPAPPPPLAPKPTPTPRPLLLTDLRKQDWFSILSSPDGRKIITRSPISNSQSTIQVWDAKTLQLDRTFGAQRMLSSLAISPDGKRIIVGEGGLNGKFALVYDIATGQQVLQLPYRSGTTEFTVSPDGRTLALGHVSSLDLYDLKAGRLLRKLPRWLPDPAASWAGSPTFSPDGKRIAFVDDLQDSEAYADGLQDEVGVFSIRNGRRLRIFGWPHNDIRSINFSPDGRILAVVVWQYSWSQHEKKEIVLKNQRVLLCDARTGRVMHSLPTRQQAHVLAFSPNGKWLACGSADMGLQIWDAHTGSMVLDQPYDENHAGEPIHALDFTPDSQTLLIAGDKIRLLPINSKTLKIK